MASALPIVFKDIYGVYEMLPNRTIYINPVKVDPAILPVPTYPYFKSSSSTAISSPTTSSSTASPTPSVVSLSTAASNKNLILYIVIGCSLAMTLILAIVWVYFRQETRRWARKYELSFTWIKGCHIPPGWMPPELPISPPIDPESLRSPSVSSTATGATLPSRSAAPITRPSRPLSPQSISSGLSQPGELPDTTLTTHRPPVREELGPPQGELHDPGSESCVCHRCKRSRCHCGECEATRRLFNDPRDPAIEVVLGCEGVPMMVIENA